MTAAAAGFTLDDFAASYEALWESERLHLGKRLRVAGDAVTALAARVDSAGDGTSSSQWSARQVLAHIAVASEGWERVLARIAAGRISMLRAADVVRHRDTLGDAVAALPVREIATRAVEAHERLMRMLETMPRHELGRVVRFELGSVTIEELFRVVVVAHLEEHAAQLQSALG